MASFAMSNYSSSLRRSLSVLFSTILLGWLSVAPLHAEEVDAQNESERPPVLSDELKMLIDGMLEIHKSNYLLYDQNGIEQKLGVRLDDRKAYDNSVKYRVVGNQSYLRGEYSNTASFAKIYFAAIIDIFLDTELVCAHLPQVIEYIGHPFKRNIVFFTPEPSSDPSTKERKWPGVKDGSYYTFTLQDEKTSAIKSSFILSVLGPECISRIRVTAGLKQP